VKSCGQNADNVDYDYVIIGSGFGGSVSALRLTEKGYKVLVLEKGKRLGSEDFPRTNWNLKRWLWMPLFRFFGFFKITWFHHITVLSGVGVGGGSLVYANTLPVPKQEFFLASSWSHLADWQHELREYYPLASRMLGTVTCPRLEIGDESLQTLAKQMGKESEFEPTEVAIFFGEPEKTVPDPYFNGKGPDRSGCRFCGGCMVGCRYNAKNTLDKNYLYLAEKGGASIRPESLVYDVRPINREDGVRGYRVFWRSTTSLFGKRSSGTCTGVVFSGGVLGTVKLLLKLKKQSLSKLSDKVGSNIRTNSESLVGVTTLDKDRIFSEGIAISSILHTDEHSHLEPVRYPSGSGFWRLLGVPLAQGRSTPARLLNVVTDLILHPIKNLRVYFVRDWAKRTQILLFMQTLDSTLRLEQGIFGMKTAAEKGTRPTAYIPEAGILARKYASLVNGKPMVILTEMLFGIPTTAHILGGAVMGRDRNEGVIDKNNKVFGYENMYVCDGSMISANPGVNPSLTIAALSERAMSKIPRRVELTTSGSYA
jgi:cholesterol oxidase